MHNVILQGTWETSPGIAMVNLSWPPLSCSQLLGERSRGRRSTAIPSLASRGAMEWWPTQRQHFFNPNPARKSEYGEGTLYWVIISQKGQRKQLASKPKHNTCFQPENFSGWCGVVGTHGGWVKLGYLITSRINVIALLVCYQHDSGDDA